MVTKPRILYVDDEHDNLLVFKMAFRYDFDVVTADSAEKGIEILSREAFDVIVSDQRMPDMTGAEFFERVNSGEFPSPCILLTGYSDMQAMSDAINKGHVYNYCTKPWKVDELRIVFVKAIEYADLNKRNKQLIVKLDRTVKELDSFLYRASHDLKAPITSQLGLLNLLKSASNTQDAAIVSKIQECIVSFQKTVKKMEALSNLGYNFLDTEYAVDLDELVSKILVENYKLILDKRIRVQKDVHDNSTHYFHKVSMEILLECLIENAIHFTRFNASNSVVIIHSTFDPRTNELELEIQDNGVGIEPRVLPHVFDPFFRGLSNSGGSGLGLFVARKMCESMQGSIDVVSDQTNGTKLSIHIPSIDATEIHNRINRTTPS